MNRKITENLQRRNWELKFPLNHEERWNEYYVVR